VGGIVAPPAMGDVITPFLEFKKIACRILHCGAL